METKPISLEMLSPSQRKALLNQLMAEEAEKEAKIKAEREGLKKLTDESIGEAFVHLADVSKTLASVKTTVVGIFDSVIELKKEVYNGSDDNYSHTFTSMDGLQRIIIGFNVIDYFDDSVTAGLDGLNQFLNSLDTDANSAIAVDIARESIKRDSKGNLNARKVMKLHKMAVNSARKEFIDNVNIIVDAYKPIKSKIYIKAMYRDAKDLEWKNIPLGITEASTIESHEVN